MDVCDRRELRALLDRHGFGFSRSKGQNFLIERWVPQEIAQSADLDETCGVLEIGPGVGSLTLELARDAAKVLCIELDKTLKPILAETLADRDNVAVVYGDALKLNIPELVRTNLMGLKPVVCANLPYNVTTPMVTTLLESGVFESLTLMVQKEVAERFCAEPGKGDYGAFTLYLNWHCEAEKLFDVPPECFMPAPKVTSAVVRLVPRKTPPCAVKDERFMFRVIRASFNQRRKTMLNGLTNGLSDYSKEQIEKAIITCGFDVRVRGESLSICDFARLADELKYPSA